MTTIIHSIILRRNSAFFLSISFPFNPQVDFISTVKMPRATKSFRILRKFPQFHRFHSGWTQTTFGPSAFCDAVR